METIIEISDYFNLNKIIESGQCFRAKHLTDDSFLFLSADKMLRIKQIDNKHYLANWDDYWKNYFDLASDYSKKIPQDDFLLKAFQFSKGIRILHQDPWEMLISFIISQRKSIPAIKTSIERICKNFGTSLSGDLYAFPTPEQLFKADFNVLKTCGLGYRIQYIQDTAKIIYTENINLNSWDKFSTEKLLEKLLKFNGVGPKVANCVALFAYGRGECVPIDTWINKIIQNKYNGQNIFGTYGKKAGIMQQYAFYYLIKHKHSF